MMIDIPEESIDSIVRAELRQFIEDVVKNPLDMVDSLKEAESFLQAAIIMYNIYSLQSDQEKLVKDIEKWVDEMEAEL